MFFKENTDHLAAVFWYYKNQTMQGKKNITETINGLYDETESPCLMAIAGLSEDPYLYYANRVSNYFHVKKKIKKCFEMF